MSISQWSKGCCYQIIRAKGLAFRKCHSVIRILSGSAAETKAAANGRHVNKFRSAMLNFVTVNGRLLVSLQCDIQRRFQPRWKKWNFPYSCLNFPDIFEYLHCYRAGSSFLFLGIAFRDHISYCKPSHPLPLFTIGLPETESLHNIHILLVGSP